MSKAFTKEDDSEEPALPRLESPLQAGARNYLTGDGARRLRNELSQLLEKQRPSLLAAAQTDAQAKAELNALDNRVAYLHESLRTAEVVPPPSQPSDVVRFGATVTVKDASGKITRYRLVGVDETDLDQNWVSWQSPIARALLNTKLGQRVPFKFPTGKTELEILKIEY